MTTPSDALPELPAESREMTSATLPETRPMLWSVRRELWENRSIIIAPVAVASVALFGFVVSMIGLPDRRRALLTVAPAHQRAAIDMPYDITAALILFTAFLVGVFYCLDALYGERRDRSILFWKSLPVSNLTTVLSKASIPLVVLPAFIFAVIATTQIIMFLLSALVLAASGLSVATPWAPPLFRMWLGLLYCLVAIALWHAPLYGWLLLISSWSRRAPILWAALPPLALCIFEWIAFHTRHCIGFFGYRLIGWYTQAVVPLPHGSPPPIDPLSMLTPGKFLSTPGLWLGLVFAVAFVAATAWMRRSRDPI